MQNNSTQVTTHPLRPWLVCFIAGLFFFYEFIQMNMLNAISHTFMPAFNLTATQFGKLSAFYFYSTLIFLFPAGIILDRVSTRKIILTALTICIIGTFLFASATSFWMACLSRFLAGIGSAFCFLSCVRLASRWFPAHRMALVIGLIVTMAMTGGMVAQTPLTLLTNAVGWREAIAMDGGLGIIIAVLIWIIVRDYPPTYRELREEQQKQLFEMGYWQCIRHSYLNLQNWLNGIYTCLMNLPIFVLGGFLGNQYLVRVHNLTFSQASYISSFLFLGSIVGSPVMGWVSDRMRLRQRPMLIGVVLSILLILFIMYSQSSNLSLLMGLFFLLGFITSTQVITYPTVAESNSRLLTATSVSVVSFSVISGGAIFDPLFGWLIDLHAHTNILVQPITYSAADFRFAIWMLPVTFFIALIAAVFIKETFCQSKN